MIPPLLATCTGLLLLALPATSHAGPEADHPFVLIKGEPEPDPPVKVVKPDAAKVAALQSRGLKWLGKCQNPDGRWSLAPQPNVDKDVIPTALAVNAYLGQGHTHQYGRNKRTVARGLRWLKAAQTAGGRWGVKSEAPVLTQAFACQTLAEAYFITRDALLKPYVRSAYKGLVALESKTGGYGFSPNQPPNALATAIAVLALKAVRLSGLKPAPALEFERARDRLKACTGPKGRVGFCAPGQGISLRPVARHYGPVKSARVPLFTAGALIGRMYCGERRTVDGIRRGARLLTRPHPDRNEPLYYYLGTYAAYFVGGPRWKMWIPSLRVTLLKTQRPDGSWQAAGIMARLGGAVGTTALNQTTHAIIRRYELAQAVD